ncbi:12370_t:CDS:2, partial [Racocetra persica]
ISSRTTIYSPFYRLRDIDVIFFNSENDYVSKSGQIPQAYIETPGYCFHERSGDIFLSTRAISDTATRLGNLLLAEFAKLGKSDIISGVADRYLREVSINLMTREPLIESEFEFFIADPSSKSAISFPTSQIPQIQSSPKSVTNSPNSSQISGRKRMSLEEVLDNDNDRENDRIYDQKITLQSEHTSSPLEPERGSSTIKKEQSPVYSGGDRDIITDYDTRIRKKRRFAVGSNNNITPNNPEVMQQVRNSLKLKQQQKAIIEARQYQAHQQMLQQQNYFNDKQHPVTSNPLPSKSSSNSSKVVSQNALDLNRSISSMSKRHSGNKSNRNSRNLSVFASPYTGYNHGQRSAGMPTSAPTIKSAPSRQSVFGYPLSTNSAFRPTPHSASFNANINGLISPHNIHNIEDASPMISPAASIRSNPSNLNSPTSVSNEERPSKESFINLFDNFYDTVSDTRSLKTTLEDQIRKTTTLLQTLHASGAMIESLVHGHFREMKREVIKDMTALEKRLSKIEERVHNNAANTGMSLSPPHDTDRRLSDISTVIDDMSYKNNGNNGNTSKLAQADGKDGSSQFLSAGHQHYSPPLSSSSSRNEETQPQDYQDALLSLKARLESLERRTSIP